MSTLNVDRLKCKRGIAQTSKQADCMYFLLDCPCT